MPRGFSRDELRARQAAASDEFAATDPIYRGLHNRIHDKNVSETACAKYYVDETIALTTATDNKRRLDHFVEVLGGSIVELAARTPYHDAVIRTRLIKFVQELQKTIVTDPESSNGTPLHFYDEQESILWKDLPGFWLACAEERASFDPTDPTDTPQEMERWHNLAAFWAQQSFSASTDHSKYALGALWDAFEAPSEGGQAGNRDFLLQTACIWLLCGIEWMWHRVQGEDQEWRMERWEQWKHSLKIATHVDGENQTIALVGEALSAMEKAEQGSKQ